MDKNEEYRRKAEHCQQMADAARKEVDRQEWFLLAQSWRQMQPGGSSEPDCREIYPP
jgi:hypothetical protein